MEIQQQSSAVPVTGHRETSLLELMIVFAKHKRLIIGLPLVTGIVVAAISLALPNVYQATARILPPQQAQSGAAALLSQLGSVAGVAAGAAGIKNPNDLYVGLLKSRTIADKLVTAHQLDKAYALSSREKVRAKLAASTDISSGKDGLIAVSVADLDPKRAALLANAYVAELGKLTTVLAVTEAGQRRLFFERQLEVAKDNLAKAEMALKGALDNNGIISVDTESRAFLETMGRLRAQISAKEIQLSSVSNFVTSNNHQYRQLEAELNSLRAELSNYENGRGTGRPAAQTGQSGLQNIKVLRDVKYYQMLYELLAKQYEAARLDEAKDVSLVQTLDAATEPEEKFKPARALIVLVSAALSFFAAVILAFMLEARERSLREPGGAARWDQLRSYLRLRQAKG